MINETDNHNWEILVRKTKNKPYSWGDTATVTINTNAITLNKTMMDKLIGGATVAQVMIDSRQSAIGLKLGTIDTLPYANTIQRVKKKGDKKITCFYINCKEASVRFPHARGLSYKAVMQGSIIVISLQDDNLLK